MKTRILFLACLLALGFVFASCGDGVGVRDEAIEWGYLGGRALPDGAVGVPSGIRVTVRDIPDGFRYDDPQPGVGINPVDGLGAWRIIGTGTADTLNTATAADTRPVGPPAFPPDTAVIPPGPRAPGATGDAPPTNLLGLSATMGLATEDSAVVGNRIVRDGSFELTISGTVGEYILRFSLTGEDIETDASIQGRVFEKTVVLDVYNTFSLDDFTVTVQDSRPAGDITAGVRRPEGRGPEETPQDWQTVTPPDWDRPADLPYGSADRP